MAVTPSRRSPRRGRTPEKKIEQTSVVTSSFKVTSDSSSVTTVRVTRSVTKKLITEEKEALLSATEMKPTKSKHGYEFGGPVGVFFMMLALPAVVVLSYLFCNGQGSCTVRRWPSLPPIKEFFNVGHLIVDGWIVLQVIIYMLPIGKVRHSRIPVLLGYKKLKNDYVIRLLPCQLVMNFI